MSRKRAPAAGMMAFTLCKLAWGGQPAHPAPVCARHRPGASRTDCASSRHNRGPACAHVSRSMLVSLQLADVHNAPIRWYACVANANRPAPLTLAFAADTTVGSKPNHSLTDIRRPSSSRDRSNRESSSTGRSEKSYRLRRAVCARTLPPPSTTVFSRVVVGRRRSRQRRPS